jgi:hypothetical protein
MTQSVCPHCGEALDAYAVRCANCGQPASPYLGAQGTPGTPETIGAWAMPAPDALATATLAPVTRDGRPPAVGLAWLIAVLPAALLLTWWLVGWWPGFLAVVAHFAIVLTVVALDSRRLDRELIDVEWPWALLTPATYLFVRYAKTRRALAAAWLGTASTAVWLLALVAALLAATLNSPLAIRTRVIPELQDVVAASQSFRQTYSTWSLTRNDSMDEALRASADDFAAALDALVAELDRQDFPDDLDSEVVALTGSLTALAGELDDIEAARGWITMSRESCDVTTGSAETTQALADFTDAIEAPDADVIAALVPYVRGASDFCQLELPMLDGFSAFQAGVRSKDPTQIRNGYAVMANSLDEVVAGLREFEWPGTQAVPLADVRTSYQAAADAAHRAVERFDAVDYLGFKLAAHEFVRSLRDLGAAEAQLNADYLVAINSLGS